MTTLVRKWNGRSNRGFTLVELMVVIVILALLAGLVGNNVMGYIAKAKITTARSQIKMFEGAISAFKLDTGHYPDNADGLYALIEEPPGVTGWNSEGYLENMNDIPKDPWGGDYYYQYPGDYAKFDIWSYGADGQEGGEDEDADIYNSDIAGSEQE